MTVPDGIEVIRRLASASLKWWLEAGTVLDVETTRRCVDAGARFITSTASMA